jgi:uncharacterized protein
MRRLSTLPILFLAASLCAAAADDYRVGERLKPPAGQRNSAYREIQWENLLPKNWDPMAEFRNYDFNTLRDGDPRAREALQKMRTVWDNAPTEPSLNGKAVRIAGFVIPLERKGDLVTEMLLVPYFGACIHVPPPPANQTIHVVLRKPVSGARMMDAFWVNGRLSVTRGDSGMGIFGYRLEADSLQPYQFMDQR